jgi:tellurium resistance protein TerD
MAINLTKGQRVDIGLQKIGVGLGWDPSARPGVKFDLDASAFMLAADKQIPGEKFFVFYNNLESPDRSIRHSGDNLTGDGDGDDEALFVDLGSMDAKVDEIVVVVTIDEAEARQQNFGQVRNAFIRIYDETNGQELLKYELDEDFSTETAVEFGRIYKRNGAWRFEAVGIGYKGGLAAFTAKYAKRFT